MLKYVNLSLSVYRSCCILIHVHVASIFSILKLSSMQ